MDFDAQWRVTIPAHLRDFAGLEANQPVTVIGALYRIELWKADQWREQVADGIQSLVDGTSPLFDPITQTRRISSLLAARNDHCHHRTGLYAAP